MNISSNYFFAPFHYPLHFRLCYSFSLLVGLGIFKILPSGSNFKEFAFNTNILTNVDNKICRQTCVLLCLGHEYVGLCDLVGLGFIT